MKKNWWIWERPAKIHIVYTAASTCTYPLVRVYGECYADHLYGFFYDGMVRWICDLDQLTNNGKKIVDRFLNDKELQKVRKMWKKETEKLIELKKKIEKTDLKKLNDKELLQLYNLLDKTYLEWWSITQVAEMVSYGGENILKEKLTKDQLRKYFSVLVTPTDISYTNEEENDMFELVKISQKKGFELEELKKRLKQHAKKYHWIQNSYGGTKELDETHFLDVVKEHIKEKADVDKLRKDNKNRLKMVKKQKEDILNEINADKKTRKLVKLLDEFCCLQDERKGTDMQINRITDIFCMETARRKKIPFELLEFCVPDQIRELLSGKNIPIEVFKKQKHRCVIIFNDKNYKSEICTGQDAFKKEKEILGDDQLLKDKNEIDGMCANTGRYTGRVRKIINLKDVDLIKHGEVLVTTMTTPNFVPAMKKAGAIVTDEGGITSHAAIIARELGIPCVIGTKIATKVLEDGMIVEIRANHGLVRIIK